MPGEKLQNTSEAPQDEVIDTEMPVVLPTVSKDETDSILDLIDEVLEPNPEKFVLRYIQANGE